MGNTKSKKKEAWTFVWKEKVVITMVKRSKRITRDEQEQYEDVNDARKSGEQIGEIMEEVGMMIEKATTEKQAHEIYEAFTDALPEGQQTGNNTVAHDVWEYNVHLDNCKWANKEK